MAERFGIGHLLHRSIEFRFEIRSVFVDAEIHPGTADGGNGFHVDRFPKRCHRGHESVETVFGKARADLS